MHRFALATFSVFIVIANSLHAQEAPPIERPIDEAVIERLAKQAEPDLQGRQSHLRQYVDSFRFNSANDARLCVYDVTAEPAGAKGVRLSGFVEFPEMRTALEAYFHKLGFTPVENKLETLPAESLGAKRFGFIKSAHSLSYAEPAEQEIVTDCLLGESLFLLRRENDHYLVHNGDGYLGFVAAKDVLPVDEVEFAKYLAGPRVSVRKDQPAADGRAILAASRLKYLRTEGDAHVAQLPTGEEVKIPAAESDLRDTPAEQLDVVCTNAKQLLGTKYLWGGKTSDGVDCSGLVQIAYGNAGVRLPRDSTQQIHMGQLTGTRWSRAAMRRGDTLYFINPQGKISHTGLYLGDDQFIHAVSPVVRINSFNPADKNYDQARHASFAFARRLWE
ncbi:MAG: C40 family peptidase [Planctomycetaceae bacterium]|nr:C40 family peptidase [Planctomycetaceae bacterium]